MGCHTWLHKKSTLTLEEAREKLIKQEQNVIDEYSKMPDEEYAELFSEYPRMYNKESLIELYTRRIKRIQNPNIKPMAIFERLEGVGMYFEDKGYYEFCKEDFGGNPFRVRGYPDDCLFSLEETLAFIKKYEEEKECKVEIDMEYLTAFWNKYPDGMINFG